MNQTRLQRAMERNRATETEIVKAFALIGKAAKRAAEQIREAFVLETKKHKQQ